MPSVVQHESNLSLTGERPQARMSARVRVKVDTLGGRRDGGVSGGKGLRLGLKTGEKIRISRHKIVQFLQCTKHPAQTHPQHRTSSRGDTSLRDTEVVLFPDKGQEGLTGLEGRVGRGRETAQPTQLHV